MQDMAIWAQEGPGCLWRLTSTMAHSFHSADCKPSVNAVTVTVTRQSSLVFPTWLLPQQLLAG